MRSSYSQIDTRVENAVNQSIPGSSSSQLNSRVERAATTITTDDSDSSTCPTTLLPKTLMQTCSVQIGVPNTFLALPPTKRALYPFGTRSHPWRGNFTCRIRSQACAGCQRQARGRLDLLLPKTHSLGRKRCWSNAVQVRRLYRRLQRPRRPFSAKVHLLARPRNPPALAKLCCNSGF